MAMGGSNICCPCGLGKISGGMRFGGGLLDLAMEIGFGTGFVWLFYLAKGSDVHKSWDLGG